MPIEPMPVANAVEFDAVEQFLIDDGNVLVDFGLFAIGASLGLDDIRVGEGQFEGSQPFSGWTINLQSN